MVLMAGMELSEQVFIHRSWARIGGPQDTLSVYHQRLAVFILLLRIVVIMVDIKRLILQSCMILYNRNENAVRACVYNNYRTRAELY
jgi:hypothetical protein